jgi:hypothetical protein
MEGYGGPAQPSPTIGQCLNGGYGWLEVECHRRKTRASIPLDAIRRPRDRRHRLAAMDRGEGFRPFKIAEARLRRALIPLLVGGRTIGPTQSLFAQIFDQR